MSSFLANEAKGDWRNFKGDHYHIVYLVWSLLHESGRMAFYQGNDLLRQVPPPEQIEEDPQTPPLTLRLQTADEDEWIQLKAVQNSNWACTPIFRDLLANFLFNALFSRSNSHNWSVKLVTISPIDGTGIRDFIAQYANDDPLPQLRPNFKRIVDEVVSRWNAENSQNSVTVDEVEQLGLEILRQLALQKSLPLNELKLECQVKLTELHPNSHKVQTILNTLSGALLEEASKGPQAAQFYDLDWLEQAAGESLRSAELLENDPHAACEEASRNFLPRDWNLNYFTPRRELEAALMEFLVASERVFCLIGLSGTGKSWTTAWVLDQCQDHLCLLVSAAELELYATLPTLVASRLRNYTSVQDSDETLLKRWKAASTVGKAPVLILDDLLVSSIDARRLRNHLKRLQDQARQYGIKLIFTCQAQIWRINDLGDDLDPSQVFSLLTAQDDPIALPAEEDEKSPQAERDDFEEMERASRVQFWQKRSLKNQRVSFVLEDFNPDELEDAVKRRLGNLPEARRDQIAYQLRSPAFAALRNPFLLDQYLKQQSGNLGGPESPPPLNVDSLLDNRVRLALGRVAEDMGCDATDLQKAFNFLVVRLWDNRNQGIDASELGRELHQNFGWDGSRFIQQLRLVALLTPQTPLLLERTPVAERLFALELEKRLASGRMLLEELRLEEDSGTVAAYLRHLSARPLSFVIGTDAPTQPEIRDVVAVAQELLDADRRWLRAVCDGLAQASPDDVQVVSFLATLMRPPGKEGGIEHQACRSLGRLAARGGEALRWVASMYLSGSFSERTWGALALSEILEFDPRRVGKIVARRLGHAAQIDAFAFKGRERRDKWLRWALDPLSNPRHQESARIAKEVATSYAFLVTQVMPRNRKDENKVYFSSDEPFDWKFAEDLAELRGGQIAWDETERAQVLRELSSETRHERLMASLAMRPASFSALDAIADVLLERLRLETDGVILSRLLWASYGLARPRYAARLLTALREGPVSRWDDRLVCGPALGLLSRLALRDAQGVFDALPRQLDNFTQPEAMYLHEALVYAWWALAGQSKQLPLSIREVPWQHLQDLSQLPDEVVSQAQIEVAEPNQNASPAQAETEGSRSRLTPRDGWTFWAKGVALARLALLGRDHINATESQIHEMGHWWPYYFAELEELTTKHVQFLRAQPHFSAFQEALIIAARTHVTLALMHVHSFDLEADTFKRMGFHAAHQSLTSLAVSIARSEPALEAVEQVQRTGLGDWEQIYLIRSLLERGSREEALIRLAEQICEELGHSQTANGGAERERTLAVLAEIRAETEEEAAIEQYREQTENGFWGYNDRAGGLAHLTDFHPGRLLEILDKNTQNTKDLLTLYLWSREARDWRALLIAKVFARMFDSRPIRRAEAKRLCYWLLTALQALPESDSRQQWWTTYSAIYSVLTSGFSPGGQVEGHHTPLQHSHLQTMILLDEAVEQGKISRDWLDAYFAPSHTLIRANTFSVEETEVSYSLSQNADTLFCYPAIRLLGVALDKGRFDVDPVARRMQQREKLHAFLKRNDHLFHPAIRQSLEQKNKEAIVKEYENLLAERQETNAPRDDEFCNQHTTILLLADLPESAQEMAERYIAEVSALPFATKEVLHGLWYNLACAQSRLTKEEEARASLLKAASYVPLNGEHMAEDTDLISLRDQVWFQELIAQFTVPKPTRTVQVRIFPPAIITDVYQEGEKYSFSLNGGGNQFRFYRADDEPRSD